jgi:hypothetical protein
MEIHATPSSAPLRRHADLAGAAASAICLIHCLATPIAVSIVPGVLRYLPGDSWFHRALSLCIVLLGAFAFIPGYRIHRRKPLLALIGAGISLILVVAWAGEGMRRVPELALSIPGSSMLVAAHLLNRTFCRQCDSCSDSRNCTTTDIN